uniref:Uncharacterized protein n=1 Tax=Eutreptiella gymnastica TaxID=73025 RepID=A0A7S1IE92_9EUGL|mmetsp:Transcript_149624/g.261490  ORF Transcript_149624/g.261490 Transcript_149624/m.261490 type:complete len:735 (+) Transcript_149624:100-2304(+)
MADTTSRTSSAKSSHRVAPSMAPTSLVPPSLGLSESAKQASAFLTDVAVEEVGSNTLNPTELRYPGFIDDKFPGDIPVKTAINDTLGAQGKAMKSQISQSVVNTLYDPRTKKMLLAAFWYFVLGYFQNKTGDEIDELYGEIADNYMQLFISLGMGDGIPANHRDNENSNPNAHKPFDPRAFLDKDRILGCFPDLCSQVIYNVLCTLYSRGGEGRVPLGPEFKKYLLARVTQMMTGIELTFPQVSHWPAFALRPIGSTVKLKKKKPKAKKPMKILGMLKGAPTDMSSPLARWKRAAKGATFHSQVAELKEEFDQISNKAKLREHALQKAIEAAVRKSQQLVPTLELHPRPWFEQGKPIVPKANIAGVEDEDTVHIKTKNLLIEERSPLLKYFADSKQIHLNRQSEAKITTAMPSEVDVMGRPIVYQPAAKKAVANSRSMLAEDREQEKTYNVAKTEEVQLLTRKLRALEADRKALINLIIIESASSSERSLKITVDTKRWLRQLEAEKDRPIGDPADISNCLTRYASVTIHIAQHLHEFPAFERERLMHASFRVHRRALQLQKELESRAHHDVDFLNIIACLADATKAPVVDPKQVSSYIDAGYKGQVPRPPGMKPALRREGAQLDVRAKPPERGWERVNKPESHASPPQSPRKDTDDDESTESSPTKAESVHLVVAPPSGHPIPHKPQRQHLLMTEMQKRQLSPVPLNALPPIPPFALLSLRSRQQKKVSVRTI